MSTGRKLVSDVRAMHKLLSTDNLVTDRAIFSEIKNNALLLVKRETNLRKLWDCEKYVLQMVSKVFRKRLRRLRNDRKNLQKTMEQHT